MGRREGSTRAASSECTHHDIVFETRDSLFSYVEVPDIVVAHQTGGYRRSHHTCFRPCTKSTKSNQSKQQPIFTYWCIRRFGFDANASAPFAEYDYIRDRAEAVGVWWRDRAVEAGIGRHAIFGLQNKNSPQVKTSTFHRRPMRPRGYLPSSRRSPITNAVSGSKNDIAKRKDRRICFHCVNRIDWTVLYLRICKTTTLSLMLRVPAN